MLNAKSGDNCYHISLCVCVFIIREGGWWWWWCIVTVPDLAPVPPEASHLFALFRIVDRSLGKLDVFSLPFQLVEVNVPDLASLVVGEVRIVDHDMDARDKRVVESPDAVGGEEHQPLVVL